MEIQYRTRPAGSSRRPIARIGALAVALLLLAPPLTAQRAPTPDAARVRWRVATPDATLAWFTVLADLRLPGAGAFAFTAGGTARPAQASLARTLAASRESEILHFVPLYHPSADRAALAEAVRTAAGDAPPTPRATLLVGALRKSLPTPAQSAQLPALATALLAARPAVPDPARVAQWQVLLDSLYLPALAPWLLAERLDEGRLIIAPALGAEGRLFSATADRTDNLVAVGSFAADTVVDAPLLAFTRELCFPAVSRAARDAGLREQDPASARRASLAAVRCGATLLDRRLPSRADAYRRFWLVRLSESGAALAIPAASDAVALRESFARAFPPDAALSGALDRALGQLPSRR